MADLSLDVNPASSTYKDFLIVRGDLILTSDAAAGGTNPILQNILQNISFFLGEWFLDNTKGLPWFQQVLIKGPDQSKIDGIFSNAIMRTLGVKQLLSYSFSPNLVKRNLKITFSALTTSGRVDYSGTIQAGSNVT